ncbi:hypothetical protein OCGS_2332 [Oceaniovalibus guishaninsula JLT2003]|uniref:Glutamyl/glutaminyl-tRNA synthetase class Ib catalytic domain-containing protein n=1 Tax=Oceaniovalibus guishaninsula JLT2003 TaxID=1231392 RepID=K2I428_9RHOB|nr:tRNA glutamyl-Q(34) synthetase GluQRS [Oceaniovalibus guishaninsula]EKE43600.1 hypothetical protein OCGS_2332 [Oceaniovalibus guishaninsula JLT2003]
MRPATRFAPSPTGPLHLGHAYAAFVAHDLARDLGGTFHLRIEDIDRSRCRPEWEAALMDDLRWLGLDWTPPVLRQSDRLDAYRQVLHNLWDRGLLYPCTCKRRDIVEAASAPQGTPPVGPDGIVYPGTCRQADRIGPMPDDAALRLDLRRAIEAMPDLAFVETGGDRIRRTTFTASDAIAEIGDIVLARRDMGTSYHLSVVLDDAAQGITHVTRGGDLSDATKIHVILQRLLDLPTPVYHHHRLIRDADGRRLAKRDDALPLALYRADGATPDDIRRMVGITPRAA